MVHVLKVLLVSIRFHVYNQTRSEFNYYLIYFEMFVHVKDSVYNDGKWINKSIIYSTITSVLQNIGAELINVHHYSEYMFKIIIMNKIFNKIINQNIYYHSPNFNKNNILHMFTGLKHLYGLPEKRKTYSKYNISIGMYV